MINKEVNLNTKDLKICDKTGEKNNIQHEKDN